MTGENFKNRLNNELSGLGDKFIILLNTNSEYYFDSVLEALKFMTNRGMSGIYLTFARPYHYLTKTFKRYDIDAQNLFFIDTVSCMAGKSPGEQGGCVFIESPSSLEEVGAWTEILMGRMGMESKFLIVDSVPTLLIYNEVGMLKNFSQILINRLRLSGGSGVFASIDAEIPTSFYETLSALCDKTIKV